MEFKEQKLSHIRNEVDFIIDQMEMHAKESRKLPEVEKSVFSSLLALGLSLLSYYIEHVKLLTAQQGVPTDSHGKKMQHKGVRRSSYFSVFGRMEISRVKYYSATDKTQLKAPHFVIHSSHL